jgi:hypothetical protein
MVFYRDLTSKLFRQRHLKCTTSRQGCWLLTEVGIQTQWIGGWQPYSEIITSLMGLAVANPISNLELVRWGWRLPTPLAIYNLFHGIGGRQPH